MLGVIQVTSKSMNLRIQSKHISKHDYNNMYVFEGIIQNNFPLIPTSYHLMLTID